MTELLLALPPEPIDAAGRPATAERRGHARYHWRRGPRLCCYGHAGRHDYLSGWAAVLDVSADGVALVLGAALEPGAVLLLQLPGLVGRRTCLARVIRTEALPSRGCLVGCRFTQPLAEAELAAVREHLGA